MLGAQARGRLQRNIQRSLARARSFAATQTRVAASLSSHAATVAVARTAAAADSGRRQVARHWGQRRQVMVSGGRAVRQAATSAKLSAGRSWRHAKKKVRSGTEEWTWANVKPTLYMDDGFRFTVEFGPSKQVVARYRRGTQGPGDNRRSASLPAATAASCAIFACMVATPMAVMLALMWSGMEVSDKVYTVRRACVERLAHRIRVMVYTLVRCCCIITPTSPSILHCPLPSVHVACAANAAVMRAQLGFVILAYLISGVVCVGECRRLRAKHKQQAVVPSTPRRSAIVRRLRSRERGVVCVYMCGGGESLLSIENAEGVAITSVLCVSMCSFLPSSLLLPHDTHSCRRSEGLLFWP